MRPVSSQKPQIVEAILGGGGKNIPVFFNLPMCQTKKKILRKTKITLIFKKKIN